MLAESQEPARNAVAGGLVASQDEQEAESQDVVLFEALAVHFRLEQDADQILARGLAPFFEHSGEELHHLRPANVGGMYARGDGSSLFFRYDVDLILRIGRARRTVGQLEH